MSRKTVSIIRAGRAVAFCLCLPLVGCSGTRKDISNDPTYRTDYATNQIYQAKLPVFVERISLGFGKSKLLVEKPGRIQNGPETVDEYHRGDKKKWPNVVGLIEPKTKIRITKLEYEHDFEMGDLFYIYAEVLDGPLVGKVIDVHLISKRSERGPLRGRVPTVDPDFLDLVRD